MRRKGKSCLLVVLSMTLCIANYGASSSADKAVVIGGLPVKTDFAAYGIEGVTLSGESLDGMNGELELSIAKNIDQSMLVVIGEQAKPPVLDKVFSSSVINKSLSGMMGRGGILLILDHSWDNVKNYPVKMREFIKGNGGFLVTPEQYKKDKADKDVTANQDAAKNSKAASLIDGKFKLGDGSWKTKTAKHLEGSFEGIALASDSDKNPVILMCQSDQKGAIIWCFAYGLCRSPDDKLMGNIIVYLYGDRKK